MSAAASTNDKINSILSTLSASELAALSNQVKKNDATPEQKREKAEAERLAIPFMDRTLDQSRINELRSFCKEQNWKNYTGLNKEDLFRFIHNDEYRTSLQSKASSGGSKSSGTTKKDLLEIAGKLKIVGRHSMKKDVLAAEIARVKAGGAAPKGQKPGAKKSNGPTVKDLRAEAKKIGLPNPSTYSKKAELQAALTAYKAQLVAALTATEGATDSVADAEGAESDPEIDFEE